MNCIVEIGVSGSKDSFNMYVLSSERRTHHEVVKYTLKIGCQILFHYLQLQCRNTLKYKIVESMTGAEGLQYCNEMSKMVEEEVGETSIPAKLQIGKQ